MAAGHRALAALHNCIILVRTQVEGRAQSGADRHAFQVFGVKFQQSSCTSSFNMVCLHCHLPGLALTFLPRSMNVSRLSPQIHHLSTNLDFSQLQTDCNVRFVNEVFKLYPNCAQGLIGLIVQW
jgi:hypothetical protein